MMPCFDLVDWKCKLKSVRFYIIFDRGEKCLPILFVHRATM